MSQRDFLTSLGSALLDVVAPLEDALQSPEQLGGLLLRHGWRPPAAIDYAPQVRAILDVASLEQDTAAAAALLSDITRGGVPSISELSKAFQTASSLVQAIQKRAGQPKDLTKLPAGTTLVTPLDQEIFWKTFPAELVDGLLVQYLEVVQPALFAPLLVLGVIDEVNVAANGVPGRFDHIRDVVHWDALPALITDPGGQIARAYGWGASFQHDKLLARLERALHAFGFPAGRQPALHPLVQKYYAAGNPNLSVLHELQVPLIKRWDVADGMLELGLAVFPIPAKGGLPTVTGAPTGILVGPYGRGAIQATMPLGGHFVLVLAGGFDTQAPMGIEIRPGQVGAMLDGAVSFDLGIELQAAPPKPFIPIGNPDSHRLEVTDLTVALRLSGDPAAAELVARVATSKLEAIVDFAAGDGFLTKIFGTDPHGFTVAGALAWSSKTGFGVEGRGGFQLVVPVNKTLGPVHVDSLTVALRASAEVKTGPDGEIVAQGQVALMLGVTGRLALGPVTASVDNVGLSASLVPRPRTLASGQTAPPGTFGYLDPAFGFKSPDGVGLKVEGGPLVGGGYLYFDPDNEQYAGVMQLDFKGIGLKAIGLLTTRMPDGSKGFSLLVIITAEFPPFQLGFGFTLNRAGGLVGVNRTMIVDVLRAGIKAGTLDSVLFPSDPVANAPRIISDLRAIFPPVPGSFVVGPMATIGWGSPSILTIDLGIVLSFPAPLQLALLGRLDMELPSREKAVVAIHMDVLGVIEFTKGAASLDATLYDSRILVFTLTGGMAMRMRWGQEPMFALAAGGFHPRFQPPPGFPTLERLALALAAGDNPRLRFETYLALTSNTAQIGAKIDFYAAADVFLLGHLSFEAWLGFDTLFQFVPFQMEADLAAGAVLKRNGQTLIGIMLDLHLTGPGPWHLYGSATFSFLGDHTLPVDLEFGVVSLPEALVALLLRGKLADAFADPASWAAQLPQEGHARVSLREFDPGKQIIVHPLGELNVRQRLVPLDVQISRVGNAAPADGNRFAITDVHLELERVTDRSERLRDAFAPASFFELTDAEKLARPSFEQMTAGTRIAAAALRFDGGIDTNFDYEDVIVRTPSEPPTRGQRKLANLSPERLEALAHSGAAAHSQLLTTGDAKYRADGIGVGLDDTAWVVARRRDLASPAEVGISAGDRLSYTEAAERLRSYEQEHPEAAGTLQVVGEHEVVRA